MQYVVCGWYTPDYGSWAERLKANLDRLGEPHNFVEVPKQDGGWEANTMAKARHVLDAMRRHPDKVIIFLDVDCEVLGPLAPLADIRGDVGLYFRPRRKKSGHTKAAISSGTMVFKPNAHARAFVQRWLEISRTPEYGDVDQDSLLLAINTTGVMLEHIGVRYLSTQWDKCEYPVIFHRSASKDLPKISTTRRRIVRIAQTLALWRCASAVVAVALSRPAEHFMTEGEPHDRLGRAAAMADEERGRQRGRAVQRHRATDRGRNAGQHPH